MSKLLKSIIYSFFNKIIYATNRYIRENELNKLKNEVEIGQLICSSDIVILINSTVLYEASSIGKFVAIYKKLNYPLLSNSLSKSSVCYFTHISEFDEFLDKTYSNNNLLFFKSFSLFIFEKILK